MANSERRPILNIEGERVALGPLRRDLDGSYQRWMNDFSTVRTLERRPQPITEEAQSGWLDRLLPGTDSDIVFTLYERAADTAWRAIGVAGLNEIELLHRKCTLGIVIGEPDARGRGLGTEAVRLLLDYGFTALGLNNILLTVHSFNPAGIHCYTKAGFKEIGRRRQARRLAGEWHDEVLMDAIASEFTSPVLAKVFRPAPPR